MDNILTGLTFLLLICLAGVMLYSIAVILYTFPLTILVIPAAIGILYGLGYVMNKWVGPWLDKF